MSDSQVPAGSGRSLAKVPEQGDTAQPGDNKPGFLPFGAEQPLYFPLIQGQIIRLIELAPGVWNDPISIRLFISELQHAPEYDAISYVWGDASKTVPIACNGRKLNVTLNLHAALKRIRLTYRSRIVWADAICINQRSTPERSHHVAFMGDVYRHATKVLVCMGRDTDGGAEDVASLVKDMTQMIFKYKSVTEMPVLHDNDPIYEDHRWPALCTLHSLPWFQRAWVIQEVGIARDPRVLYGAIEFSYQDLMKLAQWTMKCAPALDTKFGIGFYTIHTDWADWSDDWNKRAAYPDQTFMDLLNTARWLHCKDPRDHIYSLLGHPLARSKDGSELILEPDYEKDSMDVWYDLAARLIEKVGLKIVSCVEHNEEHLATKYPSWVPWCWPEEYTSCSLGSWYDFYFCAGTSRPPPASNVSPFVDEKRQLHVQGYAVDSVKMAFPFTPDDMAASPTQLRAMASTAASADNQPTLSPGHALRSIWLHAKELGTESVYGTDWLTAFSLTIIAGISAYDSAEDDMAQHRRDFASYFKLWLQGVFGPNSPECLEMGPTLTEWAGEGDGNAEKFYVAMRLMCDGRCFLFTENGGFGLTLWFARPGDHVCVVWGAKCPLLLRERGVDGEEKRFQLVQDGYLHGLMRGEALERGSKGEMVQESFFIC